MRTPSAVAHVVQQADQLALLLQIVEQPPHALQVLPGAGVGPAGWRGRGRSGRGRRSSPPLQAARPSSTRRAAVASSSRRAVSSSAAISSLGLVQGAAAQAGVEEVGGLLQRGGG